MLGTPELPNVPGTKLETPVLMPGPRSRWNLPHWHMHVRGFLRSRPFHIFSVITQNLFFFLLSLLINVWSLAFSDGQKKKVINGIKVALLNLLDQHGKKVANPICGAVSFRYASLCAMRLRCVPGNAWWPRQPLMGAKSCCIHWFPPHIALFPSRSVSLSLFWCEKFVPRQTNSCVFPDHP